MWRVSYRPSLTVVYRLNFYSHNSILTCLCRTHKLYSMVRYECTVKTELTSKIFLKPNCKEQLYKIHWIYHTNNSVMLIIIIYKTYAVPTFALHYNAVKQTFYIPGVSKRFVTERCRCANVWKKSHSTAEGAFILEGTCVRRYLFGEPLSGGTCRGGGVSATYWGGNSLLISEGIKKCYIWPKFRLWDNTVPKRKRYQFWNWKQTRVVPMTVLYVLLKFDVVRPPISEKQGLLFRPSTLGRQNVLNISACAASPHLRYIREWVLGWAGNFNSDISPSRRNFCRGSGGKKERNLASIFDRSLALGALVSKGRNISEIYRMPMIDLFPPHICYKYVAPQLWEISSTKLSSLANRAVKIDWIINNSAAH